MKRMETVSEKDLLSQQTAQFFYFYKDWKKWVSGMEQHEVRGCHALLFPQDAVSAEMYEGWADAGCRRHRRLRLFPRQPVPETGCLCVRMSEQASVCDFACVSTCMWVLCKETRTSMLCTVSSGGVASAVVICKYGQQEVCV